MPVKLTTDAIRTIAAFEQITKVHAKDCLIKDNYIYFLVNAEKLGLAIGKNGSVIKEVSKVLGKYIKLFGYKDNLVDFIKSLIPNTKSISMNNGSLFIQIQPKDRTIVIGKNGENIKAIREILKRHFEIKDLKVRM